VHTLILRIYDLSHLCRQKQKRQQLPGGIALSISLKQTNISEVHTAFIIRAVMEAVCSEMPFGLLQGDCTAPYPRDVISMLAVMRT
jgi:hypothetical protein